MKRSLGAHLALSYLAVILIGMGIAIPLAWLAVENLYLNNQKDNLLAQAQLAAAALEGEPLAAAAPDVYSQASNVLPGVHTRVIDPQGAAVIDLTALENATELSSWDLPELAGNF